MKSRDIKVHGLCKGKFSGMTSMRFTSKYYMHYVKWRSVNVQSLCIYHYASPGSVHSASGHPIMLTIFRLLPLYGNRDYFSSSFTGLTYVRNELRRLENMLANFESLGKIANRATRRFRESRERTWKYCVSRTFMFYQRNFLAGIINRRNEFRSDFHGNNACEKFDKFAKLRQSKNLSRATWAI